MWQPSPSYDPDLTIKLLFLHPKKAPHVMGFNWPSGFRRCGLKMLKTQTMQTSMMDHCLSCKLPRSLRYGEVKSMPLISHSQQLASAMSSACDFKSHFCKQCGPRSDCSSRSSLIWVNTVCLYAKIGLKGLQEYSADDINRQHFQMQIFLAF